MAEMALKAMLFGEDKSMSKSFKNAGQEAKKAGEEAKKGATSFSGAATSLKGHFKNLAKVAHGDFSGALTEAKGVLGFLGPAGIAAGAGIGVLGAGLGEAVKFGQESIGAFKDVAGQTLKMQRIMGGSAEDVSRLRFAFQETGVDGDTAAKAIGILSKNLVGMHGKVKEVTTHVAVATGEWRKHTDIIKDAEGNFQKVEKMIPVTKMVALHKAVFQANPTLKELGIKVRDVNGDMKPMAELLPQIAEKFKSMPNGAEKSALALKLFGKGGLALLPFLNRGAAGIEELKKKSDEFGLTLSGKDLAALKASRAAHKDWDAAMEGAKVRIGAQLLPMVTKLVVYFQTKMIPIIVKAGEWVQRHGDDIQRWAKIIGTAIVAGVKAWLFFESIVVKVFTIAGKIIAFFILNALAPMMSMWAAMLRALSHVPGFGWAKDAADKLDGAAKKARDFANALTAIPKNTTVTVNTYFKTHGDTGKSAVGSGAGVKGYASGGSNIPAGWAIVGENGPEFIRMHGGESVTSARATAAMMRGGGNGGLGVIEVVLKYPDGTVVERQLVSLKRSRGGRLAFQ